MNIDWKRIGVCFMTLASLVAVIQAQDLLNETDKTLLNDVEEGVLAPKRLRFRPDTTLLNDVDSEVLPGAPAPPAAPNPPGAPVPHGALAGRWIGVGVAPIPEVLKAHLNLADGLGVMVDQVVPDGPAAQAGLRRHDVLISAGGVAVADPQSLVNAVREAKDGGLELKWLRGAQELTAKVVPVERPKSLRFGPPGQNVPVDPQDLGRLRDWLGRLEQGRAGQLPGRMRMRFMPKVPVQSNQSIFENSLQVQIQRQNDEPAKIKVQKDGDTWELTEDDLDQLPADIRQQVESMLGGGGQLDLRGLGGLPGLPGPDGQPDIQRLLDGMGGFQDFENQFDQMNQQMERLFEEMRELRTQQRQLIPADQLEDGDEA